MVANEFLKIARENISADPRSRLSPLAISVIDKPECIIDIHTHIFDKKCLVVAYILLRMLKSKILESVGLESFSGDSLLIKNEDEIYNVLKIKKSDEESDWQQLENELENLNELVEPAELFGFDLKEAIKVLKKKSMLEILNNYRNNFCIQKLSEFKSRPFVSGILLMDLETGWGIKPETKLFQQIIEIKQILLKKPIIPFLPVDPRRVNNPDPKENLYALFLNAFNDPKTPFFGIKCYPALGYLPNDIRLDPVFRICAEKNIPVTTHCGGEIVSTFKKNIQVSDSTGDFEFTIPGESRIERARYLNDPELWIPVLEKYNNLKLNFGHFGGDSNWENHSVSGNNDRINKILKMMKNTRWKVFADFSYNVIHKELFNVFENELKKHPDLTDKIMFGTDYWVVLPAGDLLGMQKEFLLQMKDYHTSLLHSAPLNFLI